MCIVCMCSVVCVMCSVSIVCVYACVVICSECVFDKVTLTNSSDLSLVCASTVT